jgi:hypothetical protein
VELDVVYKLEIEFWPTNVVIEKGGRLVLEIASCDNPKGSPHPAVGVWTHGDRRDRPDEDLRGVNRVHVGREVEGFLVLPIIPAKVE